jgi:hypothetical protein
MIAGAAMCRGFCAMRKRRSPATSPTFFARVGQRLERLMDFNEAGLGNFDQFGARLATDSLQRFRHRLGTPLGGKLKAYFDPRNIRQAAELRAARDPEEQRVRTLSATQPFGDAFSPAMPPPESQELTRARSFAKQTERDRVDHHWRALAAERLGVLEVLLADVHELATVSLTQLILGPSDRQLIEFLKSATFAAPDPFHQRAQCVVLAGAIAK